MLVQVAQTVFIAEFSKCLARSRYSQFCVGNKFVPAGNDRWRNIKCYACECFGLGNNKRLPYFVFDFRRYVGTQLY